MWRRRRSAIDARTTRRPGYKVSIKKRALVEEIFGWSKTIGDLRKARFVGLAKVKAQTTFTFAAYNLTRMATIFGWCLSAV
jgi:IS5 family transposase